MRGPLTGAQSSLPNSCAIHICQALMSRFMFLDVGVWGTAPEGVRDCDHRRCCVAMETKAFRVPQRGGLWWGGMHPMFRLICMGQGSFRLRHRFPTAPTERFSQPEGGGGPITCNPRSPPGRAWQSACVWYGSALPLPWSTPHSRLSRYGQTPQRPLILCRNSLHMFGVWGFAC